MIVGGEAGEDALAALRRLAAVDPSVAMPFGGAAPLEALPLFRPRAVFDAGCSDAAGRRSG